MANIAIIGGGNLGSAIAHGLIKSGKAAAQEIYITRNRIERLSALKELGVNVLRDNLKAVQNSEIVIIAVKPYKVVEVINGFKEALSADKHTLVSVATGISTGDIMKTVGFKLPTFRAMPNTAVAMQESLTCICSSHAEVAHQQKIINLFNTVGQTVIIGEELMEAATVLGACGIAFVFRFMRAMAQGGIEIGFDAQTASAIAEQTVKGAAVMLMKGGLHPEQEIDKVTTPKGCTIAGLNEMEHQGFSSSLIKGIKTSYLKIEK
ncbi:MAG: pyrroline-5-carboxylate reductase [Aureispira sp.]|nr:pyrroline-5-carboxylate reductase [Aureispira sp.]